MPLGQRSRTATSLVKSRPARVSTQRSSRRSTRPGQLVTVQRLDGHAVAGAQRQLQSLGAAGGGVERLPRRFGRPTASHRIDVPLRGPEVPPASTGPMRVGGAPDAEVVVLAPIQQVVTALVTGPSPVRDLVVGQPGGAQPVIDQLVVVGLHVVVRVSGGVVGQGRARLDRQPVRRHVGRVELQDAVDRDLPVGLRLAGGAVDHVEIEGRQPDGSHGGDGGAHVVRIVRAAQRRRARAAPSTARRSTPG